MKIAITGFSHMKGISKNTGKPYEMARLYRLSPLMPWKNDNGEGRSAGFETNERKVLEVDIKDGELVEKLLKIHFQHDRATWMEIDLEPNPDDPMRNIIVGAEVAKA